MSRAEKPRRSRVSSDRNILILFFAIIATLALAACGGTAQTANTTTPTTPTNNGTPPTSGGGGGTPAPTGGGGSAAAAKYVYALNGTAGTRSGIAEFSISPSSGALTPVAGSPAPASPQSASMAATAQTHFVFVADWIDHTIASYSANESTGALTQAKLVNTPEIQYPLEMIVSPNQQWLYVSDSNGFQVAGYAIGTDGNLSPLPGSPYKTSGVVRRLTTDNAGRFLFVAGDNQVFGFSIGSNGALTPTPGSPTTIRPPFMSMKGPSGVDAAIDPGARFLFVADGTQQQMFVYAISAAGALTPVAGSPFQDGVYAGTATTDPAGKFVFIGAFNTAQVAALAVNQASGAVQPVAGSPFDNGPFRNGGAPISDVKVDPQGKFLLTADEDQGKITVFSINASTGALTNVQGSPFVASPTGGGNPEMIAIAQ
jgi:6-phosphogluconolactonase